MSSLDNSTYETIQAWYGTLPTCLDPGKTSAHNQVCFGGPDNSCDLEPPWRPCLRQVAALSAALNAALFVTWTGICRMHVCIFCAVGIPCQTAGGRATCTTFKPNTESECSRRG
eukprot:362246-Chlamydomonas_euryale.AAC.2